MGYTDYQKKTIKRITDSFEKGCNRILDADEVGLGKTFVAKGVIRVMAYKAAQKFFQDKEGAEEKGKEVFEYRVMYLCPNLNIAGQNKEKLELENKGESQEKVTAEENRLSMLYLQQISQKDEKSWSMGDLWEEIKEIPHAHEDDIVPPSPKENENRVIVTVYAITPGTSVKITGAGTRREREYIFICCQQMGFIPENKNKNPYDPFQYDYEKKLRNKKELLGRLSDELKKFSCVQNIADNDHIYHLKDTCENKIVETEWKKSWEDVRSAFAIATLDCFQYDLVILDEFQNFRDTLKTANNIKCEEKLERRKKLILYGLLKSCEQRKYREYIEELGLESEVGGEYEQVFGREYEDLIGQLADHMKSEQNRDIPVCFQYVHDLCLDMAVQSIQKPAQKDGILDIAWNMLFDEKWSAKSIEKFMEQIRPGEYLREYPEELQINKEYIPSAGEKYISFYGVFCYFSWLFEAPLQNMTQKEQFESFANAVKKLFSLEGSSYHYYQIIFLLLNQINNNENPFGDGLLGEAYRKNREEIRVKIMFYLLRWLDYRSNQSIFKTVRLFAYVQVFMKEVKEAEKQGVSCAFSKGMPDPDKLKPLILFTGADWETNRRIFSGDTVTEIVYKVFAEEKEKKTNILLLSATPFRVSMNLVALEDDDTEAIEAAAESAGDGEIATICNFLDYKMESGLTGKLESYKRELLAYAESGDTGSDSDPEKARIDKAKKEFEDVMCLYFSRMERYAVLRELRKLRKLQKLQKLQKETWVSTSAAGTDRDEENPVDEVGCGNVSALIDYLEEIRTVQGIIQRRGIRAENQGKTPITRKMTTLAVAAPYLYTFMHSENGTGYSFKKNFNNRKAVLEKWDKWDKTLLSVTDVREYEKPLGLWHGVFKATLEKILMLDREDSLSEEEKDLSPGAAVLLWVPSSIPLRMQSDDTDVSENNPFVKYQDYGKVMIFSRWAMVPRTLAFLYSYEVRRRLYWKVYDLMLSEARAKGKAGSFFAEAKKRMEDVFAGMKGQLDKGCAGSKEPQKTENDSGKRELSGLLTYLEEVFRKAYQTISGPVCDTKKPFFEDSARDFLKKIFLENINGMLAVWAVEEFPDSDEQDFEGQSWEKIKSYCEKGNLKAVLEEWFYFVSDNGTGEPNLGNLEKMLWGEEIEGEKRGTNIWDSVKTTNLQITLYEKCEEDGCGENGRKVRFAESDTDRNTDRNKSEKSSQNSSKSSNMRVETNFARCLGMSKDDDMVNAMSNLQKAFNTPFMPFVFATTSMGQEGLDFHAYASGMIHWNLPASPVDFEQREGRINRRNCLTIRRALLRDPEYVRDVDRTDDSAQKSVQRSARDIFDQAFKAAEEKIRDLLCAVRSASVKEFGTVNTEMILSGMIPHWLLPLSDGKTASIWRMVPYFHASKMWMAYDENHRLLQLYRSVLGQPNPDEVLERLMKNKNRDGSRDGWELCEDLALDFSPYRFAKKPEMEDKNRE